jgi:hypothetical protein
MGYGGDNVGVVEAWSIIQNTCQNYFEPDLSKSLCSGGLSVLHQQHGWRVLPSERARRATATSHSKAYVLARDIADIAAN